MICVTEYSIMSQGYINNSSIVWFLALNSLTWIGGLSPTHPDVQYNHKCNTVT